MDKAKNIRIIVISVIVLIILSLAIPKPWFLNPIRGFFGMIFSPVQGFVYKNTNSTYNFFTTLGRINKLAKENNDLKSQNDQLTSEKVGFLEVKKENEILKNQLGFIQQNPDQSLIPAQIISKDPTNIQQNIKINRGENDGLATKMPVIYQGFLVGKITQVFGTTSTVELITNPQSTFNILIQSSRALGICHGQIGYSLVIGSIPQDTQIQKGDIVLTSPLGELPQGIPVGEVSEILSKKSELFQSALVRPYVDFAKLETVFIIKNK